jgi:hypothetical protein
MNKEELARFLFKARENTYAGGTGKVESALKDACQLEYSEGDYLYRDVYYNGKNGFMGLEGIYYQNKLVWGMSYTGIYTGINEEEIDKILRPALLDNPETRGWTKVERDYDGYKYICIPDWEGASIENMTGVEKIIKNEKEIYTFYYGGSILV